MLASSWLTKANPREGSLFLWVFSQTAHLGFRNTALPRLTVLSLLEPEGRTIEVRALPDERLLLTSEENRFD